MQLNASSPAECDLPPAEEARLIEAAYREPKSTAAQQLLVNRYHTLTDAVHRENLEILQQLNS